MSRTVKRQPWNSWESENGSETCGDEASEPPCPFPTPYCHDCTPGPGQGLARGCTAGIPAPSLGSPGHPETEPQGAWVHLPAATRMKFPILKFPFTPEIFLAVICVLPPEVSTYFSKHRRCSKNKYVLHSID